MKFVTLSLLATALTVGGNAAEQARSSKQPNILFILADDFGWRDRSIPQRYPQLLFRSGHH